VPYICPLYLGCILFSKRHPILVECRKQNPILWKSSLEDAVTCNVVSAWPVHVVISVIVSVILRVQIIFPPKVMVTSTQISRTCGYFPGPHSQGAPYAEKEGDYQVSISSPIAATESSTTGTCQSSCLRRDYVHRCDSIRPVVGNRRHSTIPNRTADQFRKRHALTSCANIG
jgi:hypothetical protein